MRVAVTGGTGFVGSHTVAALCSAGHDVRMLVRSARRVSAALDPLGVDPAAVEVVTADITDRRAVDAGVDGMDAIVNAASVFSFDPRRASEVERTNSLGLHTVMEASISAGLDPIVHVSSFVALMRDDVVDDVLTPDSPPGDPSTAYPASKARQDIHVRELQARGEPVIITYPGGVYGPCDPHDGESVQIVRAIMARYYTLVPDAGMPICDVRDVAAVHAAVIQKGQGPRRYMAGGHYTPLRDLVAHVARVTGRWLPTAPAPAGVTAIAGRLGDWLRTEGVGTGVTSQGVWLANHRARVDNSRTEHELRIGFRPVAQTIEDQVRWMEKTGRLRHSRPSS